MGRGVLEGLSVSPEICSGGSSPTLCAMEKRTLRYWWVNEVWLPTTFWWDTYRWFRLVEHRGVRASLYWTWQKERHGRVPMDSDW
jgi:hypothetical protein